MVRRARSTYYDAGQRNTVSFEADKRDADSMFEVSLERIESRKSYATVMSYCREIPDAKNMSAARHGASSQHFFVRCHNAYENVTMGTESPSPVMTHMMETRRTVKKLQAKAGTLAGRNRD